MATGRLPDPNSAPVTAKGDLYTYSTVPAKLAVGNNGETLVADSSASTGLRWQNNFAAGKNKIINGDFGIWQRGTSFTISANNTFTSDRYLATYSTAAPTSWTISQQTFTAGTAPVSGYEGQYFLRSAVTTIGTSTFPAIRQRIEDVRTFAGQTVTVSFWAKADATRTIQSTVTQVFGTGGSTAVGAVDSGSISINTSWTRYSYTGSVPSISGKTIGTNSNLQVLIQFPTENATIDIWGLQIEAGSVATAFQTATGTLAGELAACQRYYWRSSNNSAYAGIGLGIARETNAISIQVTHPVTMRGNAPVLEFSNLQYSDGVGTIAMAAPSVAQSSSRMAVLDEAVSGATQYRPYFLRNANNTAGYIAFSMEL